MHELAALAIGSTKPAAETATRRGVRAARLHAIKADITASLGDGRLSADMVAARHNITPRYVRMLFEAEGTSFSEFVLDLRLQHAYRMLVDAHHLARTISAIAFEAGFSDLSYFNRTFRRRYGVPPSEVREQAQRDA
jgi:AraC-like DNA-binding protein